MRRFTRKSFLGLATLLTLLPALPLLAETPAGDEIVFVDLGPLLVPPHQAAMRRGPLPDGPVSAPVPVLGAPLRTFATPSGQLLAFSHLSFPERNILYELKPDGTMREIAPIYAGYSSSIGDVRGLAGDGRGRLYLLHTFFPGDPPYPANAIYELDPATGHLGQPLELPVSVREIASGLDGLWALDGGSLRQLDPDTAAMGPAVVNLDAGGAASNLASDSAGRIHFLRPCAVPQQGCRRLSVYDPASGALTDAPAELQAAVPAVGDFAIVQGGGGPAAVYLNGGRFRVEISYEAYDGASGSARPAPARSRDTAIFYFFDEDNWELMVKALNGCGINGHFWIYAAASTDVEYVMTVTDVDTGRQKVYSNPLGQVAVTVTDGQAFSCSF